jgi:NAD-dependent dihydropyrimidine dehydrogenase PreA subunit
MTYTITELCTREGDCVEVCPVDCIVPSPKANFADDLASFEKYPLFYIDPDVCIDCGACVPVCPPEAIFPEFEVPEDQEHMTQENADFFLDGPGYWDFDFESERKLPEGFDFDGWVKARVDARS